MKKSVTVPLFLGAALAGCFPAREETGATGPTAKEAEALLDRYQEDFSRIRDRWTETAWQAALSGKKADFTAHAEADLALKRLHSDREDYEKIKALLARGDALDPLTRRALTVARNRFTANQLPQEILGRLASLSARIEQSFNTFRGRIGGESYSNNELLERLAAGDDSAARRECWEALKQVGAAVAPRLIELAVLRNQGARELGFADFWEMEIRLQEHDPAMLKRVFAELEELTRQPFAAMKEKLDGELARRFGLEPGELMPWHYDNPFFQAAPPAAAVDLDAFYRRLGKEDLPPLAREFYAGLGMPVAEILERSSLYEQPGKDQHAFCEDMDREGDVRILTNLKPTAEWMDTLLHELGHAVYDLHIDRELPFNLRQAAHALTTEGVAMLFGALAKNPAWIARFTGADQAKVAAAREAILAQRRREQLIFCRWTLVMFHFEKALYADPEQDLNRLWWDLVERYQSLRRPPGRDEADWAAKPHFTIAPVYYHNYMLGELFAAQLRAVLAGMAGHRGAAAELEFNNRRDFGDFLKEKVFAPGKRLPWPELVEHATGAALTAKHFAAEVR